MRIFFEILNSGVLRLHAWFSACLDGVRLNWILLALISLSLLSNPLTQHLWAWDGFLHGGQDFETAAFLMLVSLCLIAVLARACKLCLERLLLAVRALALLRDVSRAAPLLYLASSFPATSAHPGSAGYTLPLLI